MRNYRHELKFVISKNISKILKQRLGLIMQIDKNSNKDSSSYLIRSLYFDDPLSTAYYEKLDGVLYRKKYRIRIYNNDESFIRLERKWKHNNMTSKDQVNIDKDILQNILNNNYDNIDETDDLIKEFIYEIKIKGLKPSVIVDYERLAYIYPVSDVRITFDENLKSGLYNYDIFDNSSIKYNIFDSDEVILEVKFNDFLPSHISDILNTVPMYRQAVSKFARCRSIK